ncbi:MAG: DNA double-strand break repair nuclease NurA [Acidobacteriota bacterium]
MIFREKILTALENSVGQFVLYQRELNEQIATYRAALENLVGMNKETITELLAETNRPSGAIPTEEFYSAESMVLAFEKSFANREEAREWAYVTLLNHTTFAADGSQLMPTKDFSIPLAAVQTGWFENPHRTEGTYIKDTTFEILSPDEVMVRTAGDIEASFQAVQQRRYALEIEAIKKFMTKTLESGFDATQPPVVFFDNLLVISFAELLPESQRDFYVNEIIALLDKSKETGIPVIGYIDTSMARDLVNLLITIFPDLNESPKLQDAALLTRQMKWGDRTPLFRCARAGILEQYGETWRRDLGFVYLKTTADAPPSRIDVPMWVYEKGLLEYVLNIIRGEVIVGNGYPYVIEAADATAVITQQDRERFYAIFQEFAERNGFQFTRARKAISKSQRR